MTQVSYYWGGTVTGDAVQAPYSDDEFSDLWAILFLQDRTTQGVIGGYNGTLFVSNPAGTTIRVISGAAIVDGKLYLNTANVDFTVTAPGAGSNYYRIVLQKDWTAQTVRLAQLGPNAVAPPAVTQSDGTTWEISLATVQITSGGVITITDTRDYCMTPVKQRQGGSGTHWDTPGAVLQNPQQGYIQVGIDDAIIPNGSTSVSLAITFPKAYVYRPIVFLTIDSNTLTSPNFGAFVSEITTTGCTVYATRSVDPAIDQTVHVTWMAMGQLI